MAAIKYTSIVAHAHPNIALIKYWGKRDTALNLPAVSSLSITLDTLLTTTSVSVDPALTQDQLVLDGHVASANETAKVANLAAMFRAASKSSGNIRVNSENDFPTAAGLASSAAGFAALVVALDVLYDTRFSVSTLSQYARIGSGSAGRSLFGGFALMRKGQKDDGSDSVAEAFLPADHWPLTVAVAVTSIQAKATSSTVGMESTRSTSPYYTAWLEQQDKDIVTARLAIEQRDFAALAKVSEYSCLKMHGLMLSAQPGLLYWNAATLACLHEIRTLRSEGVPVFFTVDAGPQVKAVCEPQALEQVQQRLSAIQGVQKVITTGLGRGAWIASTS